MLNRRQFLRYGVAGGFTLWLLRPNFAQAATTFNIHYNLAAWPQNTALSLGARRSNGGNAYQVITAGTTANVSGAGPTGTGSNITDGTVHWKYLSAIDYVSLQDWANNMPATQGDNYLVQLWNNGLITTTTDVQFLSYQTDAAGFSTLITCAPGEGISSRRTSPLARNQANGVMFQAPSSGAAVFPYFFITTANTTISGIQYYDPQAATGNTAFVLAADNNRMDGCLIDAWSILYTGNNNVGVANCLLINRETGTSGTAEWPVKWDTTASGAYVVNCHCIQAGDGGPGAFVVHLNSTPGSGIVRNSSFFGTTEPVMSQNVAGAWVIDHCGFDVSSANEFTSTTLGFPNTDGGNNLFSLTAANQFINTSTDFRLKSSSDFINAGTTDTTDIPAANDIYGVLRPQGSAWDIGAQEFVPAGGSGGLLLSGVG